MITVYSSKFILSVVINKTFSSISKDKMTEPKLRVDFYLTRG